MENTKRLKILGINLKCERLKASMSQEQLAELTDLSRNFISMVETGKMNPTILKVADIAKALNIDINELLKNI